MSTFAQHDDANITVSRSVEEIDVCAFCPASSQLFDEDGSLNSQVFQLISCHQVAFVVCERCWWKAWHDAWHVRITDGVHTIVEPTPAERMAAKGARVNS